MNIKVVTYTQMPELPQKFVPELQHTRKCQFFPIGTVLGVGASDGTVIMHGEVSPPDANGRTWYDNITCLKRSVKNCPLCLDRDECPLPAHQ